jgi:hypothetical protein
MKMNDLNVMMRCKHTKFKCIRSHRVYTDKVDMLSAHHKVKKAEEESAPPTPAMGMQQLMLTGPGMMMQPGMQQPGMQQPGMQQPQMGMGMGMGMGMQ